MHHCFLFLQICIQMHHCLLFLQIFIKMHHCVLILQIHIKHLVTCFSRSASRCIIVSCFSRSASRRITVFFFFFQIRVKRSTLHKFSTYGELYLGLCSATGEIPIAIYRTERTAVALKCSSDVKVTSPSQHDTKKGKKVCMELIDLYMGYLLFIPTPVIACMCIIMNN